MTTANDPKRPAPRLGFALFALAAAAPAIAQTAPAPADPLAGDVITLDVFNITAAQDAGYLTQFTLSGSLVNTRLELVPANISVMSSELLRDLNANDFFDAVRYSVGAYNMRDGFTGAPGGNGNSIVFRGIQTNWQARDNFRWYVPSDNYNADRLEINRGPVGILYGESATTGVLNTVTRQANPGAPQFFDVSTLFDEHGTWRFTTDFHLPLTDNFAVRLMTLSQDRRYWVDSTFDKREGVTGSLVYEPLRNTRIRFSGEWGNLRRVPLSFVAIDRFSGFDLNRTGLNNPGPNPPGTTTMARPNVVLNGQLLVPAKVPGYVMRMTNSPPRAITDGNPIPINQFFGGDYGRNDRRFEVFTLEWEQQVARNFVFKLSANYQKQRGQAYSPNVNIHQDINRMIPSPANDGTLVPNPRFGELFTYQTWHGIDPTNTQWQYRALGLYDLQTDFMRQQITFGTYHRRDHFEQERYNWGLDPAYAAQLGLPSTNHYTNRVHVVHYLADGQPKRRATLPNTPNIGFYAGAFPDAPDSRISLDSYYINTFGEYLNGRLNTMIGARHDVYDRFNRARRSNPQTGFTEPNIGPDGQQLITGIGSDSNTIYNYGAVLNVWGPVSVYYNKAQSFIFASYTDFYGELGGPRIGKGDDYGVRLNLFENQARLEFGYFDNRQTNENVGSIGGENDERFQEVRAFLPAGTTLLPGGSDSRDRKVTGWEVEIVGNLGSSLTYRFGYSEYDFEFANQFPRIRRLLEDMAAANAPRTALQTYLNQATSTDTFSEKRFTWALRYTLPENVLAGAFVGTSGFYNGSKPAFGGNIEKAYTNVNLLFGYRTKVFGRDTTFRLNAQNVFDKQILTYGGFNQAVSFTDPRTVSLGIDFRF